LLVEVEIAATLDLLEEGDQSLEGTPKSVYRPRCCDLNFTSGDGLHQAVEAGPLIPTFRAADPLILEDVHDIPAEPLSDLHEDEALVLSRLRILTDTEVEGGSLHRQRVARIARASRFLTATYDLMRAIAAFRRATSSTVNGVLVFAG
jgi:hypothetical protein